MRFARKDSASVGRAAGWGLRVATGACAVVLAAGVMGPVTPARAQTSAEVRAQAAAENERLEELVAQLDAGRAEVDGLEAQIKDLAQQSIEVQGVLIEDRAQLSTMVETDYRWGGMPSLWDIALSSETLDDFVSRLYYANKVTQWQAGCVEQLNQDKSDLEDRMEQIEVARNDRREALAGLESTCADLSASVDSLLQMAEGLEAEERAAEQARLAEIARQAALEEQRVAQQRAQVKAESSVRALAERAETDAESLEANAEEDEARAAEAKAEANEGLSADDYAGDVDADGDVADDETGSEVDESSSDEATDEDAADTQEDPEADEDMPEGQPDTTESDAVEPEVAESEPEPVPEPEVAEPEVYEPEPEPEPAPEPELEPEPEADFAGDWISCIASAYSIADNTPPGSTATASGIPLDESVPTVAMPISSDPSRFYGSMIQIEYEGMTVIATVTDCGGLSGGSRGLDLTPAVFRAFGASTCDEWGLRSVRYRFL